MTNHSLSRSIVIGALGGLVGTFVMDLFGLGLLLALGGPASLSLSIIGDAAAAFFVPLGIKLAGGEPLGAALHYLIGPALGGLLGAGVAWLRALRLNSIGRGVVLGILYVEVISQPLLIAAAVVLKMNAAQAAQWFGVSFVMHLVYGGVLGWVAGRWLRTEAVARIG